MSSHAIALIIRVSAKHYKDAARQLRSGNLIANPLAYALSEQGIYVLSGATAERITLMDIDTGRCYSGSIPAELTDYLTGFQRGVRVFEDHEFDLVLDSEGDRN
jgi:hypothetical protein